MRPRLGLAGVCFLAACSTATPSAPPAAVSTPPLCTAGAPLAYPPGSFGFAIGATLPDLAFATETAPLAMHELFEPCAAKARILVVRASAAWCGTCRWHAAHTGELRALDIGSRLVILDAVIADEDNAPAKAETIAGWRARIQGPDRVAADPTFALGALSATPQPLPLIALVDSWTMTIRAVLHDPAPSELEWQLRAALAEVDGATPPARTPVALQDGRFTREQWDMLHDMTLPGPPPPDPTNAKADDPAAASLGKTLFADTTLSDFGVACATCHRQDQHFMDGAPRSHDGVALVDRNSPSILLAAHSRWQFWDGRADTLWMQALGPIENAREFGSSRLFAAHAIFDRFKASYEAIFPALPALSDTARFPAFGKPGDAAWQGMATEDQDSVTRVFVNIGKAIAAYERTLRVKPNLLDRYVAGESQALTDAEKDGLAGFFGAGCTQCHYGPRLTDDAFHIVRFPTGRVDLKPDTGRSAGVPELLGSAFRADGPFSDAPAAAHGLAGLTSPPSTLGAFKTPPLRGVADTAPYGHGGTFPTLEDVIATHCTGGAPDDVAAGSLEPWVLGCTPDMQRRVVTFLRTSAADPE